jgi:glutamate-ammonia-ligase adenylyltransferase
MEQALGTLQSRGLDLSAALRVLRQLVMERIIVLDCEQQAPLAVVTKAVTELAELALDRACTQVRAELDARHGAPQGPPARKSSSGSSAWASWAPASSMSPATST